MAAKPSMGEVLTLSHTAKSIGKIFGIRAEGVPQDFFEVDRETQGLADALKLLAYTFEDDNLILQSKREVQRAIFTLLGSAQTTLKDLAAFVERYCTFRKVASEDGLLGDKIWDQDVLTDWRTLPWTRDGADIWALRSLLMMHCTTVTLTTQALQSQSIERLEQTVLPMAPKLASIHQDIPGSLNARLDDLHNITTRIMIEQRNLATPNAIDHLSPHVHDFDPPLSIIGSRDMTPGHLGMFNFEDYADSGRPSTPPKNPARINRRTLSSTTQSQFSNDTDETFGLTSPAPVSRPSSRFSSRDDDSRPSSRLSLRKLAGSRTKSDKDRKSHMLPSRHDTSERSIPRSYHSDAGSMAGEQGRASPAPRKLAKKNHRPNHGHSEQSSITIKKSEAASKPQSPPKRIEARDSATFDDLADEMLERDEVTRLVTPTHSRIDSKTPNEGMMEGYSFMENLQRDAFKVFDGTADLVEAMSSLSTAKLSKPTSTNTVISKSCRVLIVKRKNEVGYGPHTWSTSIWVLAVDGSARVEQPLPTMAEPRSIAPHISFTDLEKVVLTFPTRIHYHATTYNAGQEPKASLPADRVAYNFSSSKSAFKFQSAIFGQELMDSFQIDRAVLIKPGAGRQLIRGLFGPEEPMCGQQRIRLWEDDGGPPPNHSAGGVLALMHLQPSFGQGWVKWWVNSARVNQVKSKGNRVVEIRGIDTMVHKPVANPQFFFDRFVQSSLVEGESWLDEEYSYPKTSFDRPSTAMSNHSAVAVGRASSSYSRSVHRKPSSDTLRSSQTDGTDHTSGTMHSIRNLRNLSFGFTGRSSRSRSPSSSQSRSNSRGAILDADEPLPPPPSLLRRDSGNSSSPKATASPSTAMASPMSIPSPSAAAAQYLPVTRSGSTLAMNPYISTTSGKWDTPVAPRPSTKLPAQSGESTHPSNPSTERPPPHIDTSASAPMLPSVRQQPRIEAHTAPPIAPPPRSEARGESRLAMNASTAGAVPREWDDAVSVKSSFSDHQSRSTNSGRASSSIMPGGGTGVLANGAKSIVSGKTRNGADRGKRKVYGIKLYFSSDAEKDRFLRAVAKARERMLALPDC